MVILWELKTSLSNYFILLKFWNCQVSYTSQVERICFEPFHSLWFINNSLLWIDFNAYRKRLEKLSITYLEAFVVQLFSHTKEFGTEWLLQLKEINKIHFLDILLFIESYVWYSLGRDTVKGKSLCCQVLGIQKWQVWSFSSPIVSMSSHFPI